MTGTRLAFPRSLGWTHLTNDGERTLCGVRVAWSESEVGAGPVSCQRCNRSKRRTEPVA